jgi:hypothetical protein
MQAKVKVELTVECDEALTEEQITQAVIDGLQDHRWSKVTFAVYAPSEPPFEHEGAEVFLTGAEGIK